VRSKRKKKMPLPGRRPKLRDVLPPRNPQSLGNKKKNKKEETNKDREGKGG